MRIISLKKDRYILIKKLFKEIETFKPFELFSSDNVFLYKNGKTEIAMTFIDNFGEKSYGISFFINSDGLNTLHDMLTVDNHKSLSYYNYNVSNIMYVDKELLSSDELYYFEKNNIRVNKKNNMVIQTYKKGFQPYISTNDESKYIWEGLCALYLVLSKDLEKIKEGFKNKLSCVFEIFYKKHQYALSMQELPYLERSYSKTLASKEEIKEFDGIDFTEDSALLVLHGIEVAVKSNECNKGICPLLTFYETKDSASCETIFSIPNQYRMSIITVLKDFFLKYGKPKALTINDRKMYYELYDLINNLGIELSLELENELIDDTLYNINEACVKFFGSFNDSYNIIDRDEINVLTNIMQELLNNPEELLSEDEEDLLDDEINMIS